jgi:quercetin 2,3-dioxygenase
MTGRQARERGTLHTRGLTAITRSPCHQYDDPRHIGCRDVLVINEDAAAPGMGFGTHRHQHMESLSSMVEGQRAQKDSNQWFRL